MKIIISHDVDHISAVDHWKDMIIPKHLVRSVLEYSKGYVTLSEISCRIRDIVTNKWNYIDETMQYDKMHGVPSTFFFGMANGLGMNYSIQKAQPWIMKVLNGGFDAGVHGISYDDRSGIKQEFSNFKDVSGLKEFGIRMHYLRNTDSTVEYLSDAGYLYDTTLQAFESPYKVNNMWEFPVHLMDIHMFYDNSRWQNQDLSQAKEKTINIIDKGLQKNITYLSILFHDRLFCNSFKTWKNWYEWMIEFLKSNNFEFINYKSAIKELNSQGKPNTD